MRDSQGGPGLIGKDPVSIQRGIREVEKAEYTLGGVISGGKQ